MLKMPQVKNRAKVPKEAVRVQAKAVNHQVAEAEENPLEAAAKAENHQVVEKAVKAAKVLALERAKAVNLVQAKAEKAEMVKEKVLERAKAKATEMAKHPRRMEHQVKMQEMITKMRLMLRLKQ
tara:strand:+ start:233 stop:604 length:372 start_codon:yes stop_codon:yes gene_type:complete